MCWKATDAAWRSDIDRINALFYDMNATLDGSRPELAIAPLKRMRTDMIRLRQRNGIAYYLDDLVAFSEPMEAIVLVASRKEPVDDAVGRIRVLFPAAKQAWQRVAIQEPREGFKLTAGQREEVNRRRDAETSALDTLEKALAGKESAAVLSAATGIKPPFERLYYFFGDFHTLIWE